jgi:hypothetical protein
MVATVANTVEQTGSSLSTPDRSPISAYGSSPNSLTRVRWTSTTLNRSMLPVNATITQPSRVERWISMAAHLKGGSQGRVAPYPTRIQGFRMIAGSRSAPAGGPAYV